MCNEQSFIRNAVLCNDSVKMHMGDSSSQTQKQASVPVVEEPKIEVVKADIPETKTYNPPGDPKITSNPSSKHVCFRDADSIYCLICQTPMFFVFANDLEYPDDFPDQLFEKVALLEKVLTEEALMKIVLGLNGGVIPGSDVHVMSSDSAYLLTMDEKDDPMKITVTINEKNVIYSGPSGDAWSKIFTAAVVRERPIILQVVIINSVIVDREDMFLVIYPNGCTYLLDPSLGPCSYPQVEIALKRGVDGVKNDSNGNTIYFMVHSFWNLTCVRQSPTYISFTESPMWKPLMNLVLMSMISIGLSIKDAVAVLVAQDKQTMSLLLDFAVERLIAAIIPPEE